MSRTVLLVDHEPIQRQRLGVTLARHGWDVREAADGNSAIALVNGDDGAGLDALVLDFDLPGRDGLAVLRAIRSRRPALPAIMLAAQDMSPSPVAALRAGANDFLVKPAAPDRLIKALDAAVAGHAGSTAVPLFARDGHMRPLTAIEADIIRLAIGHYHGRMSEVARRLNIGRSTLYRKLAELGIDTNGKTAE